uniref:UCP2f n=1 Tax=Volvox carteri f. nagariensis TaxID=3068 RepID=D9CJ20_VOLCA|nr:UCP2f [Volvox carteri f. nagariensis]
MQLQGHRAPGIPLPGLVRRAPCGRGDFRTATSIVREGGIISLWKGLPPAVPRGFLYGGELGLYGPCKDSPITGRQALAGDGRCYESPPKTRLQAKGSRRQGTWGIVGNVVKESGVAGLWRGAAPSMTRAALLTLSQVATYDIVKHEVMRQTGGDDYLPTFLAASLITGLVTTTITIPVNVLKTRMFVAGAGWSANYAGLGPLTAIRFLISELLRLQLGLDGLLDSGDRIICSLLAYTAVQIHDPAFIPFKLTTCVGRNI